MCPLDVRITATNFTLFDTIPLNVNKSSIPVNHTLLVTGSVDEQVDPDWIIRDEGREIVQIFNRYSLASNLLIVSMYICSDVGIAVGRNRFNLVRYTGSFHIIEELEPDDDYAGFIFGYQDNR